MRIATYNVNGVNGRLPRLLEWLKETSPDIVCLQEIKTTDEKCPARALEEAGYGSIWHGQRSHHGVAILAKGETPREVRRGMPGNDADTQARYIEAELAPGPQVQTDADLLAFARAKGTTVFHPTSTCRMGSDVTAVVDERLRVHGFQGLRVADASIMPTVVSGNTNAACVMIGEKASDMVLEDARKAPAAAAA